MAKAAEAHTEDDIQLWSVAKNHAVMAERKASEAKTPKFAKDTGRFAADFRAKCDVLGLVPHPKLGAVKRSISEQGEETIDDDPTFVSSFGYRIDSGSLDVLCRCLPSAKNLRQLRFWNCGLTGDQIALLAQVLPAATSVVQLAVDYNPLPEPGLQPRPPIDSPSVSAVSTGRKSSVRPSSSNTNTSSGSRPSSGSRRGSRSKLNFILRPLEPDESAWSRLISGCGNLASLSLRGNQISARISRQVVDSLVSACDEDSSSLLALDLGDNRLGDEGAQHLAKKLVRRNRTIKSLSVARNNLTTSGVTSLLSLLCPFPLTDEEQAESKKTKLRPLVDNDGTPHCIGNDSLQQLFLSGNNLDAESFRLALKVVDHTEENPNPNTTLKLISLPVPEDTSLADVLRANFRIRLAQVHQFQEIVDEPKSSGESGEPSLREEESTEAAGVAAQNQPREPAAAEEATESSDRQPNESTA